MARTIDASLLTEILARSKRPALFAWFDFQSGAVRVWNGIGSITWGGNTYTGLGDLGSISPVKESADLRANGMAFTLSGLNSSMLTIVLAETYNRRECALWLGALNSSGALVSDPLKIFAGRMASPGVSLGAESASITIRAESKIAGGQGVAYSEISEADLIEAANICDEDVTLDAGGTEDRYTANGVVEVPMRRFTDEDQHLDFASDTAFKYLASSANKVLTWGKGPPSTGTVAPPGGGGGVDYE
jgi:hypothetical protein